MAKVLIIDDDEMLCQMLAELVESVEHQAEYALTLGEGLDKVQSQSVDIVFLDVHMPDGNGLEALSKIRSLTSAPEVIIVTGVGDADGAGLAVRNGAWDYIQKPVSPKKIILPLKRVLQYRDSLKKSISVSEPLKHERIVAESTEMKSCLTSVLGAVSSIASVLISGETGTGKELIAKAIHVNSSRSNENFVAVDCGSLEKSLSGSQLFGHKKGAFTGADSSREGLIKHAHKGTLFLDEVGELSLEMQKVFLRVLQERRFRPLGQELEFESDFRLISATNRDLEQMVEQGKFRIDLLYRLKAIPVHVPPLRERPEDIRHLVLFHGIEFFDKYQLEPKEFSSDFYTTLESYPWPGNVRELVNALEVAIHNGYREPVLFSLHLPENIRVHHITSGINSRVSDTDRTETLPNDLVTTSLPQYKTYREQVLLEADKQYFEDLMRQTEWDIQSACRVSGLGRTRLYTLLKKYNISRTGWSS